MSKLKFISIALLSVALASCATFTKTEKRQIMDFVDKSNVSAKEQPKPNCDLLQQQLSEKDKSLQQTNAEKQFLTELYTLEIELSSVAENPSQQKFDAVKRNIENIKSKDSLSIGQNSYYEHIVKRYNAEYRKFILNN